jgi:hypothetical protein
VSRSASGHHADQHAGWVAPLPNPLGLYTPAHYTGFNRFPSAHVPPCAIRPMAQVGKGVSSHMIFAKQSARFSRRRFALARKCSQAPLPGCGSFAHVGHRVQGCTHRPRFVNGYARHRVVPVDVHGSHFGSPRPGVTHASRRDSTALRIRGSAPGHPPRRARATFRVRAVSGESGRPKMAPRSFRPHSPS